MSHNALTHSAAYVSPSVFVRLSVRLRLAACPALQWVQPVCVRSVPAVPWIDTGCRSAAVTVRDNERWFQAMFRQLGTPRLREVVRPMRRHRMSPIKHVSAGQNHHSAPVYPPTTNTGHRTCIDYQWMIHNVSSAHTRRAGGDCKSLLLQRTRQNVMCC